MRLVDDEAPLLPDREGSGFRDRLQGYRNVHPSRLSERREGRMEASMRGFRAGGMMDETPLQRALRLSRENGYYGHLPDPEKEVDFVIQPRRKKDANA